MHTLFSKKLLIALAFSAVLFSFTTKPDKANFSGTWALNEGKSDFGQRGARFATKTIKVDQKADAIAISRTTPSFQGGDDVTTTETLTFDGKEVQSTGFGNSTRKSTLKWADDGQTFTISSNTTMDRNGQTVTFTGTETWALGDGGKSLTVTTVRTTQQGEVTTKAAYDKQ
ncbi:MAG: hypothetical protein ACHQEB_01330 [Chitinophagales bacterium]